MTGIIESEGKLFVLRVRGENKLYVADYNTLLGKVRELLEKVEPEQIELLEVAIGDKEINASVVPWSRIAKDLIKMLK